MAQRQQLIPGIKSQISIFFFDIINLEFESQWGNFYASGGTFRPFWLFLNLWIQAHCGRGGKPKGDVACRGVEGDQAPINKDIIIYEQPLIYNIVPNHLPNLHRLSFTSIFINNPEAPNIILCFQSSRSVLP